MIFLLCGLYNPVRGWAFGRAISVGFTYGYSRQAPWGPRKENVQTPGPRHVAARDTLKPNIKIDDRARDESRANKARSSFAHSKVRQRSCRTKAPRERLGFYHGLAFTFGEHQIVRIKLFGNRSGGSKIFEPSKMCHRRLCAGGTVSDNYNGLSAEAGSGGNIDIDVH